MCFYNTKYSAAKRGKIFKKFFVSACAIVRFIFKDKNRSISASRRSGIMNVSAIQLNRTKKQMNLCELRLFQSNVVEK
jgi:hypothetical protein